MHKYEQSDLSAKLFFGHEVPETIFEGGKWHEGPCYFPASRSLIWSDIPNDRLMRYDEITGQVSVFRSASKHANGNTVDRTGRLVTCEHGSRSVTLTDYCGTVRTLASTYEGRPLNSPNDVVVRSDGTIWFTDPSYGIETDYFGNRGEREQAGCHVYRYDPRDGVLKAVITTMMQPNGLHFSADESHLYVVESARTAGPDLPGHIRRFAVSQDDEISDEGAIIEATVGFFDGFRLDSEDRIWAGAGDGVHCYASDGRLLGKILTGHSVINLCFGGPKRNILYMCSPARVLRVPVRAQGQCPFSPPPLGRRS